MDNICEYSITELENELRKREEEKKMRALETYLGEHGGQSKIDEHLRRFEDPFPNKDLEEKLKVDKEVVRLRDVRAGMSKMEQEKYEIDRKIEELEKKSQRLQSIYETDMYYMITEDTGVGAVRPDPLKYEAWKQWDSKRRGIVNRSG